jgi:hypothetical protein
VGFRICPRVIRPGATEHGFLRRNRARQRRRLGVGRALRQPRAHQHRGAAGEDQGDEKEDQGACAHRLATG